MKSEIKEWIAVFLIHLVLTLPFYVGSVYATPSNETNVTAPTPPETPAQPPPVIITEGPEGIISISVKGSDGIGGFAKSIDFVTFNAVVSISNDTITNDQVTLGTDIPFDKCSGAISKGSECTLRFPGNGTDSFETQPFTINLYKDDRTLKDSKSGTLIVDNKPPQVKLSISKSKFSSQDSIIVDYDAADFACDEEACSGKCVGLKKIEFFTLDGLFKETVDITAEECNAKSSISIEPKKLNDGKNSIFAKAFDKFEQVSPQTSVTFGIDTSAPDILLSSFAILRSGINLNTFSPHKVPVDVTVNISADDLNAGSVIADLSALNPSQKNLKSAKGVCTSVEDNLSLCRWSIELAPATGGSKNIIITASDTSGNKENVTISRLLSLDDKGPVVQSLSTATTKGSQVLAKPSGNTVTAVFEETTGLSAEQVFLHIGNSKVNAKVCSKSANWACEWNNINFGSSLSSASSAKMSIESDTTDILLNPASESKGVQVTIDSKAPVLKAINTSPVGGSTQAFPEFFKIGDKIAVLANLTEDNDVFATADFSKFITDANRVDGTCSEVQADERVCTWQTDSINLEANGAVTFNFSDNAGNSLIVTKPLKTFGLEEAAVPDFWTSTVQCSPSTIDRQLGPLIKQRVFCEVSLKPKSAAKAVSTVFIGLSDDCSADKPIVDDVEAFNTEAGSTSPIIKITLKKDEFKIDKSTISCSLKIFSKIASTSDITKNPEIENVKIGLAFFNLPLGEVSEEVQRKIDEAKKDAEGIWKLIGTLNKLMFYAKKICNILNTLYNIIAILYIAYAVLKGSEVVCSGTLVGEVFGICNIIYAAATSVGVSTEGGATGADIAKKGLNLYCDYITCKQTFLWGPAVKNYIDTFPGSKYVPGGLSSKMDPQHNLIVATLFVCLPGMIYGLDKIRQIKCLYADCLINAVGRDGLPVTTCEDIKSNAFCKYAYGEVFALIPYTAVFDHFTSLIKNSLSNPFAALGVVASVACGGFFIIPRLPGKVASHACRGLRVINMVADAAQNVKNIIEDGFKIRQDYCSRLEDSGNQTTRTEPEVTTSRGTPTNDTKAKK